MIGRAHREQTTTSPVSGNADGGATLEQLGELLEVANPPVSNEEAAELARVHFGLDVSAEPLVGERDRNFHLRDGEGKEFVLKVIHPAEDQAVTDFQSKMLLHIQAADPALAVPVLVRPRDGAANEVIWQTEKYPPRRVRCLTYLAGCPLYRAERSVIQKRNIGTFLGRLNLALRGFRHPADNHELLWDTKHADRARALLTDLDEARKNLAGRTLEHFTSHVVPLLPRLRAQVIHNDFNPHNVLAGIQQNEDIAGVIDFGDAVHSPLVQDLAVAAAYQFEPTGHPLEGPGEVAAAFHALYPLLPEEVEILPDFIGARFALAIAISFWRAARHPDNADYIMRNQKAAWSGLQRLNEISRDEAVEWLHKRIGTR
jgi:Ser/Thr protein kinase RdoA (MazF antagonist)